MNTNNRTRQCAFLTMNNLEDFDCYDHLLFEPLQKRGWKAEEVSWHDSSVNWNRFDAVITRSTWDYQDAPEKFMRVLEKIDNSSAHLENSVELMRWNINKRYLQEMHHQDIPIVPTRWHKQFDSGDIFSSFKHFDADKLIIKPVVSAGADYTYRLTEDISPSALCEIQEIFSERPFMIQPFMENIIMENIIHEGEYSLFYFNGAYSHAILKTPESNDFRVQEEHGGQLETVKPESQLKQAGKKTMQHLPEMPLYARIDFVRSDQNQLQLMEIELIEPSLYFNMDPKASERFAKAFEKRMENYLLPY